MLLVMLEALRLTMLPPEASSQLTRPTSDTAATEHIHQLLVVVMQALLKDELAKAGVVEDVEATEHFDMSNSVTIIA